MKWKLRSVKIVCHWLYLARTVLYHRLVTMDGGNINYFTCTHNCTSARLKALRDSLIHSISFSEKFRKLIYIFFINSHDVSVLMCNTFCLLPPLHPIIPSLLRCLPCTPHFVSMSLHPSYGTSSAIMRAISNLEGGFLCSAFSPTFLLPPNFPHSNHCSLFHFSLLGPTTLLFPPHAPPCTHLLYSVRRQATWRVHSQILFTIYIILP